MIRGAIATASVSTAVAGLILTGHHIHKRPTPAGSANLAPVVPLARTSRGDVREPLPVCSHRRCTGEVVTPARHASRQLVPHDLRSGSGSLDWSALAECESSGNPRAVDPSGTYFGLYQFDILTWRSVGGRGNPSDASRAEQKFRARILYGQRGRAPWPVCGVHL